jgi:uncharacterized damage-inducible protein DinB
LYKTILLGLMDQAQRDEHAFVRDLPADEREAAGSPDLWSAKDHIAHVAYWRRRFADRLQAALDGRPQPDLEAWETMNARVFEERRRRPWADVLADADNSYQALGACLERLTDEDLLTVGRFDWVPEGRPLLATGSAYEHALAHLAQYHVERGDRLAARRIQEGWVARVLEAETPDPVRGEALYNLACFQALDGDVDTAAVTLERAFASYPTPHLRELARTDPDLAELRARAG